MKTKGMSNTPGRSNPALQKQSLPMDSGGAKYHTDMQHHIIALATKGRVKQLQNGDMLGPHKDSLIVSLRKRSKTVFGRKRINVKIHAAALKYKGYVVQRMDKTYASVCGWRNDRALTDDGIVEFINIKKLLYVEDNRIYNPMSALYGSPGASVVKLRYLVREHTQQHAVVELKHEVKCLKTKIITMMKIITDIHFIRCSTIWAHTPKYKYTDLYYGF